MSLFITDGTLCPACAMPLIEDPATGVKTCIVCGFTEGDYGEDCTDLNYDPVSDW